jgi:hypothetical protein
MTPRRPCPPAPGPLEDYATAFDGLFRSLGQRRGFRGYLHGLLLPRDRNKTLTGLAGAEPITGAQHREVQRLQWFLTESTWDHQVVNDRRVRLLCEDPATAPHERGVLVVDDTGDRKDGTATAHVARQYLGSVGKIDNGIVAVTSLWADERVYWPVHVVPYTRPLGCRARSETLCFGPSRSWPWSWSGRLVRPASGSGRWWPTAPMATTLASPRRWGPPRSRSCWPSSLARAPGHRRRRPTPRPKQPLSSAGAARGGLANGGVSSGASATATPRPGGRPTLRSAAGARIGGCGLWWPPPTRHAAGAQQLVPAHQPLPTRQPPRPAGEPG